MDAQLEASKNALAVSKDYLAHKVNEFHQMIHESKISHDEAMKLDDLVKSIQQYTYRVALCEQSIALSQSLNNVYLGCVDPTRSAPYWQYNGAKVLESLKN